MRTALTALTDELRRLKGAGVKHVSVSEESLAALRAAVRGSAVSERGDRESGDRGSGVPAAYSTNAEAALPLREVGEKAARAPLLRPPIVHPTQGTKRERWEALREQVLNDPVCRQNVREGKKIVLGVGSLDAKIMFVGEAPGGEEEIQGEPFVGPAGQLLNRMIQAMGLERGDVYIGNIMNWRPQMPVNEDGVQFGNRPPTAEEMAYCLPYLKAQIDIVAPEYLVALGATAAQGLLGPGAFKALGEIKGKWKEFQQRPLMVTYHPSYILRNNTNRFKRMIWEDFLKVMDKSGLPVSDRQRGFFLEK